MLAGLRRRAARAGLGGPIDIRLARPDRLGIADLAGRVDLVLAFYVVHEIRGRRRLLRRGPGRAQAGRRRARRGAAAARLARGVRGVPRGRGGAGLRVAGRPRIGPNKVALLAKSAASAES